MAWRNKPKVRIQQEDYHETRRLLHHYRSVRTSQLRLKLPENWRITNNFHAVLLTLYTENTTHRENYTRPSPNIVNREPEWEIERIMWQKNRHYHVKWRGYDEMSWEPEENLRHSRESINDYWKWKKTRSQDRWGHIATRSHNSLEAEDVPP